jgi:hypothetical protein
VAEIACVGWVLAGLDGQRLGLVPAGEAKGKQPAQVQCGDRIDSHAWLH